MVKKPIEVFGRYPEECYRFVGIDPGTSNGCMATLFLDDTMQYSNITILPLKNMTYGEAYNAVFMDMDVPYDTFTAIENVNTQGGNAHGVDRLMKQAGAIIAALDNTEAPYFSPYPASWRAGMHLKVTGMSAGKKAEYLYAQAKLYTHNLWEFPKYSSDAVLLACYSYSIWISLHPWRV